MIANQTYLIPVIPVYFNIEFKYISKYKRLLIFDFFHNTNNNLVFVPNFSFFAYVLFLFDPSPPYTPIRFWPDPLNVYILYGRPLAPIHRFLGGKIFYGIGKIIFLRRHAKSPYQHPY